MTKKSGVVLLGAQGRMGQRVQHLLSEHSALQLVAGLDRQQFSELQHSLENAEVVIDFSAPSACVSVLPACVTAGVPYVLASTGLGVAEHKAVEAAAQQIGVVQAANLSVGINVMALLVEQAAAQMGSGFDIEISEVHHRHKRDAPSGTAQLLGKAVEEGRGHLRPVYGRDPHTGVRGQDEIGYSALRGGDVAGEHTVFFFGRGERLELTHRCSDAVIFAEGALRAAEWLISPDVGAGLYCMRDVLVGCGSPKD